MNSYRTNPEGDENTEATKQHKRELFALAMTKPQTPLEHVEPLIRQIEGRATIRFNVNDHVKVKLTPKGREIHRRRHDELFLRFPSDFPYTPVKEDSEGWSEWQMWCLMEAFGQHCHNGLELPFETEILILNPD